MVHRHGGVGVWKVRRGNWKLEVTMWSYGVSVSGEEGAGKHRTQKQKAQNKEVKHKVSAQNA